MLDSLKALLGPSSCPWCVEKSEDTLWDRFINWMPEWLFWLEFKLNQFWRLGRWWHNRRHLKETHDG